MVTQNITADNWYFNDGSVNYGNGLGARIVVGHTAFGTLTGSNRFAVKIPRGTLFNGVTAASQITAFDIHLRVKGGCAGIGGSPAMFLERCTGTMGENQHTVDCEVTTGGTSGVSKWPSPSSTATNRAFWTGTPSADTWITVHALALGKDFYTNGWSELVLIGIAALTDGSGYDESTNARRNSFYTHESGSIPYAEVTTSGGAGNNPPDKPGNWGIGGGPPYVEYSKYQDGTGFQLVAKYSDPDGDDMTQFEVLWTPDG